VRLVRAPARTTSVAKAANAMAAAEARRPPSVSRPPWLGRQVGKEGLPSLGRARTPHSPRRRHQGLPEVLCGICAACRDVLPPAECPSLSQPFEHRVQSLHTTGLLMSTTKFDEGNFALLEGVVRALTAPPGR
jgi:hypothetical protein